MLVADRVTRLARLAEADEPKKPEEPKEPDPIKAPDWKIAPHAPGEPHAHTYRKALELVNHYRTDHLGTTLRGKIRAAEHAASIAPTEHHSAYLRATAAKLKTKLHAFNRSNAEDIASGKAAAKKSARKVGKLLKPVPSGVTKINKKGKEVPVMTNPAQQARALMKKRHEQDPVKYPPPRGSASRKFSPEALKNRAEAQKAKLARKAEFEKQASEIKAKHGHDPKEYAKHFGKLKASYEAEGMRRKLEKVTMSKADQASAAAEKKDEPEKK